MKYTKKTYYWKVIASTQNDSIASQIWSFTTILDPLYLDLISPANNTTDLDTSVMLNWNSNADNFILCYGTNSASLSDSITISSETAAIDTLLDGFSYITTYYWKVKGVRDSENIESPIWSFTTDSLIYLNLIEPEDGAVGRPPTLQLKWESNADSVEIYYGPSSGSFSLLESGLTADNIELSGLDYNETYFWYGIGKRGIQEDKSEIWSFSTDSSLVIELSYPDSGSIGLDTTLTLMWSTNADSTSIYYGLDPANLADSFIGVEAETQNLEGLAYDSTYY